MVVFTELMRQFWIKQRTTLQTRNFYHSDGSSPSTSTSEDADLSTFSESKYKRSDHKAYSNATLIRRSIKKQNSSTDSSSDVDIGLPVDEPRSNDGTRMVKCHVYESLAPESDSDTSSNQQFDQKDSEEKVSDLNEVRNVNTGLSIIDENLASIGAILSSPTKQSTNKSAVTRRQQQRLVTSASKSNCWDIFRGWGSVHNLRSEGSFDSLIVNSPEYYRSRISSDRFMRKDQNQYERVVASNIYEVDSVHKSAEEEFMYCFNSETRDFGSEDSDSSLVAKRRLDFCSTPDDYNEFHAPLCSKAMKSKLGAIELSGVSITLADSLPIQLSRSFVLVMLDENRILCSSPVSVQPMDTTINFNDSFYFDNLDNKFEITGKLYCLHHSKYLQRKSHNRRHSLLGAVSKKLRYIDSHARELITNNVVTSSFVPMAHFKLNVNNFKMDVEAKGCVLVPYGNASLNGRIDFKLHLRKLDIDIEKIGMVTLRDPRNPNKWNRRWCTLTGTLLQFWKSALAESYSDPEVIIDLVNCIQAIDSASRELCLPPKTFAIITIDETYYLNIDTLVEFREWKTPLNQVYSAVCDWKKGI